MINKLSHGHNVSLVPSVFLVEDFAQSNVFVWICTNYECVRLDMHRFYSFDNWLCELISGNWQLTLCFGLVESPNHPIGSWTNSLLGVRVSWVDAITIGIQGKRVSLRSVPSVMRAVCSGGYWSTADAHKALSLSFMHYQALLLMLYTSV